MDDGHREIVIIKRHSVHEEEHHGGAWKIAFADFMTAMMAFFLVLWIINATDKNTKTIIARYFNPVKLEDPAKSPKGFHEDTSKSATGSDNAQAQQADGASASKADKDGGDGKSQGQIEVRNRSGQSKIDAGRAMPSLDEDNLFADPFASLDEIAGSYSNPKVEKAMAPAELTRPSKTDLDDPFRPIILGGAADSIAAPKSDTASANGDSKSGSGASTSSPPSLASLSSLKGHSRFEQRSGSETGNVAAPLKPSNESMDVGAMTAQRTMASEAAASVVSLSEETSRARMFEVDELRKSLAHSVSGIGSSQLGPAIAVNSTREGIVISLTDKMNFSMFAVGSAQPQARTVHVMEKIAFALKSRSGSIVIRGFTDGRQYKSGGYDNWRLSSARAEMAYYMLIRGKLPPDRVERIEGYADRQLKEPDRPLAAENRRIEILIGMNGR